MVPFDLKGFYARRVRRILPVSTLVLLVTVLAAYYWLGPLGGATEVGIDAMWSTIFLENWHAIALSTNYFADSQTASLVLHYCSLGFDEQFYVVYPLVLIGIMSWAPQHLRRRILAIVLGVVAVVSIAWAMWQTPRNPYVAYLSTYTRIWEILFGALLALLPEERAFKSEIVNAIIGWISLAVILISGYLIYDQGVPWPNAIWTVVASCGLIWTGRRSGPYGPNMVLMLKPIVYIGNMWYSLYLWNYIWLYLPLRFTLPGATMAERSVGLRLTQVAAGFLCAVASYHLVEWPLRESSLLEKKLWVNIPIGIFLIGIAIVVAKACEAFWPV